MRVSEALFFSFPLFDRYNVEKLNGTVGAVSLHRNQM